MTTKTDESSLEQSIQNWTKEHGEILDVTVHGKRFIFAPPLPEDLEDVIDAQNENRNGAAKLRQMALGAVLHPSRDEFERLISARRFAGIPNAVSAALNQLGGGNAEITVKKG